MQATAETTALRRCDPLAKRTPRCSLPARAVCRYAGLYPLEASAPKMPLPGHLLPTTVVGSYPQPDWLVDRAMLSKVVPRTRMHEMWRLPAEHLEQAQDDATVVAIRDMERAGVDIVT